MNFNSSLHNRRSLRIKNRDYSRDGYYFVTICARNRENLFANLCVGVGLAPTLDRLNVQAKGHPRGVPLHGENAPTPDFPNFDKGQPRGVPLHKENSPIHILTTVGRIIEKNWQKIAEKNFKTDAFVIMPNHIHGIIIIKPHARCVRVGLAPTPLNGHTQGVPLHQETAPTRILGSIIGAFKSRCAIDYLKYIDENNLNESAKIWQRNYYEHVIRNKKELYAIRNYIKNNPANWEEDEENLLNK
jgi:putative transposase